MMKYFLSLRDNIFTNQSLCYYGILLQNQTKNTVSSSIELTVPYMIVREGIVCDPFLNKQINQCENIVIVKNNHVVVEKRTSTDPIRIVSGNVLDLYNENDNFEFNSILNEWEKLDKIYISNTEIIPNISNTDSVAGLASGSGLAKLAFESNASHITFFDYKQLALEFQKEIIQSTNRKEIFIKYLSYLTCGDRDATLTDINSLDFAEINKLYDNLKNKKVFFLQIDFRNKKDIENLIHLLPYKSTLWISNVFHYITSMHSYTTDCYNFVQNLCDKKNINLLPYTEISYES